MVDVIFSGGRQFARNASSPAFVSLVEVAKVILPLRRFSKLQASKEGRFCGTNEESYLFLTLVNFYSRKEQSLLLNCGFEKWRKNAFSLKWFVFLPF